MREKEEPWKLRYQILAGGLTSTSIAFFSLPPKKVPVQQKVNHFFIVGKIIPLD